MSSLTSWNMSIPEKGGFNTAEYHLHGMSLVQLWMVFFGIFSLFFFFYKFTLTPEVKKIVFFVAVVDFIKFSLFLLQKEKTQNHGRK